MYSRPLRVGKVARRDFGVCCSISSKVLIMICLQVRNRFFLERRLQIRLLAIKFKGKTPCSSGLDLIQEHKKNEFCTYVDAGADLEFSRGGADFQKIFENFDVLIFLLTILIFRALLNQ